MVYEQTSKIYFILYIFYNFQRRLQMRRNEIESLNSNIYVKMSI